MFLLAIVAINTREPKYFQELRTVNGEVCPTYQEPAKN